MAAFKRFDTAAFFQNIKTAPAASAASAANTPPAPKLAAAAASAAEGVHENNDCGAQDWFALYEERAAIGEHDGGLVKSEAEAQAYEACTGHWLNQNPVQETRPDECAQCKSPETMGLPLVPVLNGIGGHIWFHHHCHLRWMAERRNQARKALSAFGLEKPSPLSN